MRIQTKLVISVFIIISISVSSIGMFAYSSISRVLTRELGERVLLEAQTAKRNISIEDFEKLSKAIKKDPKNYKKIQKMESYEKMRKKLDEIRTNRNLTYLFTMTKLDNGKYAYAIDGLPLKEVSLPGEVEENYYKDLETSFELRKDTLGELSYSEEYGANLTSRTPIFSKKGEFLGVMGADVDVTKAYNDLKHMKYLIIAIGIVSSILGTAIATFIIRRYVAKPIQKLSKQVESFQEGKLNLEYKSFKSDEIGRLYNTFYKSSEAIKKMITGIKNKSSDVDNHSYSLHTSSLHAKKRNEVAGDTITNLAEHIEYQVSNTHQLEVKVEENKVYLQKTKQSMEQLFEAFSKVEMKTGKGKADSQTMNEQIAQSRVIHEEMVDDLKSLLLRSDKIYTTLNIITNVAQRTELLALNAHIEASKGGEESKGFSVIADEVKNLAHQTDVAAKGIREIMQEYKDEVDKLLKKLEGNKQVFLDSIETASNFRTTFESIFNDMKQVNDESKSLYRSMDEMLEGTEEMYTSLQKNMDHMQQISLEATTAKQHLREQLDTFKEFENSISTLNNTSKELKSETEQFTT
ncbi:hypothetical protein bcgnr5372_26790 [Bacillus luti]|nr:methyl-accepting chemotaxis protein [Bacillus cereus]HDR8331130.1 methyl-accepting chemotaxis protein [Bacillus cereus]HDR8336602.1 methyl-accepting chemotaxis protein [Bacillus cereus]